MHKAAKRRIKSYACTVIAVVFTLIYLFPLYWMVITSFKTKEEIFSAVPTFWPKSFSLDAYITQFTLQSPVIFLLIRSVSFICYNLHLLSLSALH